MKLPLVIPTDMKDVALHITKMSQGDKSFKIAIGLQKISEGSVKILYTISDNDAKEFLKGEVK
jgi:hypothetical protein